MSSLGGYHGCYLRIDLTKRSAEKRELRPDVLRRFIGGAGLATWLLLEECPDEVDPYAPEAPLVICFSPLVGSPLTTSAKFTVAAKSPLTQRINDSLSSSAFAISGKKTGHDAIVIVGQTAAPTAIVIEPDGVRFESADELWGMSSAEAEEAMRGRFGSDLRVASIGPAGENKVRFASLSHDGRHAARGGLGAVLGAKKLKAIAVRGDRQTSAAHPDELIAHARSLSRLSLGEGTAKYRELGTVSNLVTFNRLGTLPTRNFQQGTFEGAAALAPDAMAETRREPAPAAPPARSAASTSFISRGNPACDWNTSRCSPSARCARSTTRTPCCPQRGSVTKRGSTRSAPARRWRSQWSARSAGSLTLPGCGSGTVTPCCARWG